jgi:hypothetical protein
MVPSTRISSALIAGLSVAIALSAGCGRDDGPLPELGDHLPASARAVLDNAETMELLALGDEAPDAPPTAGSAAVRAPERDPLARFAPRTGGFHGWKEASRTPLLGAERHKLLYAVYTGIAGNDDKLAACFRPHAALHATRGTETVDLLFSYDCMLVHVYENGRLFTALTTREAAGPVGKVFARAGITSKL